MEDMDRVEIMREALNKILAILDPDEWDEVLDPSKIEHIARVALDA